MHHRLLILKSKKIQNLRFNVLLEDGEKLRQQKSLLQNIAPKDKNMSQRKTKQQRREANRTRSILKEKVKVDLEDTANKLSEFSGWWRFVYAIRILFKWNPKVKLEVKK